MSNEEMKFTRYEVINAFKENMVRVNKLFGIEKALTDSDYAALGRLKEAFDRLERIDDPPHPDEHD